MNSIDWVELGRERCEENGRRAAIASRIQKRLDELLQGKEAVELAESLAKELVSEDLIRARMDFQGTPEKFEDELVQETNRARRLVMDNGKVRAILSRQAAEEIKGSL